MSTTFIRSAILASLYFGSHFITPQPAQAFTLQELSNFFGAMHNFTRHLQEDIVEPSQWRNQPAPVQTPDESFPDSSEVPTEGDTPVFEGSE
jgi:hypothetical protein